MNLLFANDAPATYPKSWYAAVTEIPDQRPALSREATADVCVIGGGYTGVSAALHLAEAGRRVILLEAHRVGFGASGRNGGQLGSGQRVGQDELEARLGGAEAEALWSLAEDAKACVKDRIAQHGIACDLKPGVAAMARSAAHARAYWAYAQHLKERHGYVHADCLDRDAAQALCGSPLWQGGVLDRDAAHLNPLAYAIGLARAAEAAGVEICEGSVVETIETQTGRVSVTTAAGGRIVADQAIVACNGYLGDLVPSVARKVMPINNFIVATEPLGARADTVLSQDVAVADDKFVVNYFRLSRDRRLLFGGGETYGYRFPADIAALVRRPMLDVFPHLKDVRIDYAWGGTLAITLPRLPYLARVSPRILSASGYSGHGVGTASHAGALMARALCGQSDGFDTFSRMPTPAFPGGKRLQSPLLVLAMTWYALRDRLGI